MKTTILTARVLLGLIFFIFGLNGFYTFIPVPEFHPFMEILVASGFIYVEKALEVLVGMLLLLNRYVLAALLLLGPLVVSIMLYHLLLDPRNWPVGLLNLLLYLFLMSCYWPCFRPLLKAKVDQKGI